MATIISLGYEWDWLDDYFVKRPWEKLVNIGVADILRVYDKKGILDISFIEKALEPLLTAKNLEDIGYNVVVFPLSTVYAAAMGIQKVMQTLYKTGSTANYLDNMIKFEEFNKLMGLDEIREIEDYYYKGGWVTSVNK